MLRRVHEHGSFQAHRPYSPHKCPLGFCCMRLSRTLLEIQFGYRFDHYTLSRGLVVFSL